MAGCGSLSTGDLEASPDMCNTFLSSAYSIHDMIAHGSGAVPGALRVITSSSLNTCTTHAGQIPWLVWTGLEASFFRCQRTCCWHQAQTIRR
jgi:hypothetical protein